MQIENTGRRMLDTLSGIPREHTVAARKQIRREKKITRYTIAPLLEGKGVRVARGTEEIGLLSHQDAHQSFGVLSFGGGLEPFEEDHPGENGCK